MDAQGRGPRLHYVPGLDGVRAFAVLAVIAFHSGFSWIPGGYYGVDAFFVLSGFLITSLLVAEWRGSGTVALGRFWARRARRLLPALIVLIAAIGFVAVIWPSVFNTTGLFSGALAATFYSANWYFIAGHANYFAAVSQPSPLLHTWSLAIEEQFYLVWPLVVLAVLGGRRRRRAPEGARAKDPANADGSVPEMDLSGQTMAAPGPAGQGATGRVAESVATEFGSAPRGRARRLEWLFALAVLGAVGSAALMAIVTPIGGDPTRAYYGTDTRAQGLLVGAALATAFARWGGVRSARGRRVLGAVAYTGVVGTAVLWWRVPEMSSLAFHGGFLLAAVSAGAVVAGTVQAPVGPVAVVLAWSPIRALGRISYGVYLWYWPVLLVMTGQRIHLSDWPLFFARVAVTVAIAALSYRLVEQPIRRGAFPSWRALVVAPLGAAAALSVVLAATLLPTTTALPASPSALPADSGADVAGPGTASGAPGTLGASNGVVRNTAHPIKVLLVGDSVAGSLGVGLDQEAARYGIQLVNEGAPGCSVSMDQLIRVLWYTLPPGAPCRAGDPEAIYSRWQRWVKNYNPDVVVYLARGELFDQEVGGQWASLGQRSFDRYVTARFRQAIRVLGVRGAAVVLLTTPYYDSGEQPSGAPWPEDQTSRVTLDNSIIKQVVAGAAKSPRSATLSTPDVPVTRAETPDPAPSVTVVNFGALASPGGHFSSVVDGVDMRCSDGVHITVSGGESLAPRLLPELGRLGRVHQAASPTGAWPAPLPPPVPSWWHKLPCG